LPRVNKMDRAKAMLIIYADQGRHIIGFVTSNVIDDKIVVREMLGFASLDDLEVHANKILEYCHKTREDGIPPEILDAFKDKDNQEQL